MDFYSYVLMIVSFAFLGAWCTYERFIKRRSEYKYSQQIEEIGDEV